MMGPESTARVQSFIRDIIDDDLKSGKHTRVVTGFPPPDSAVSLQTGRGPLRLLTKPVGITPLIAALRDVAGQD